jgi:hypothetical protein
MKLPTNKAGRYPDPVAWGHATPEARRSFLSSTFPPDKPLPSTYMTQEEMRAILAADAQVDLAIYRFMAAFMAATGGWASSPASVI